MFALECIEANNIEDKHSQSPLANNMAKYWTEETTLIENAFSNVALTPFGADKGQWLFLQFCLSDFSNWKFSWHQLADVSKQSEQLESILPFWH